jgi:hypothetical protein
MARKKSSVLDWSELHGEPEGWRELQEQARNERDPRKLEQIIAAMNQLLRECEEKAAESKRPRRTPRRGKPKRAPNVE